MRDRAEHLRKPDETKGAAATVERAEPEGPVARLQDLQRGMGNAAVVELLGAQPKMQVGGVNDPAEAEADRVAAQVLRHLDGGGAQASEPAQQRGGLARLVRRKGAPGGASGAAGHGPAGGDVLPETAGAIDAARGGGKPMDDATLTRMEGAFGTDLGDVRIHTDGQSASLNRDLNARAFTTGKDVFFGAGEYDPSSRSGQEVLAHELTHTIQQGGDPQRLMRKLSLDGTNWDQAPANVKIAESGATGGVALFMGELAVKTNEYFGPELVLAANMHGAVAEDEVEEDGWSTTTPKARLAEGNEPQQIKAVVEDRLTADGHTLTDRENDWIANAGQNWTVVFDWATGKDFDKVVAEQKVTKKKGVFSKKRKLREGSVVSDILSEPGHARAFGRSTAVDIYMGNGDRLTQYSNAQNWRVDPEKKQIVLMDNIQMWPQSFFVNNSVGGTGLEGLNAWVGTGWVNQFIAGDMDTIATKAIENLGIAMTDGLRDEDKPTVQDLFDANQGALIQAFAEGLAMGKESMLKTLRDPFALTKGITGDTRRQMLESLNARKFVLQGASVKEAWELAVEIAGQQNEVGSVGPKTRKRR